jgi:HEPN domain-containing protein
MKDNDFHSQKAKEWFKKGDHDLQTVEILLKDPNPPTDTLCFHCQQAVEKYLKGLLTFSKIDFIKTHDLEYLYKLSVKALKKLETYEEEILSLNKYSIEPRYPADMPINYSLDEAKSAFENAREIIKFIKANIKAA